VQDFASAAMALAVIAAFLLGFAGVRLTMSKGTRGRGALMIAAALVLVGNVLIWTL
jgi:hypothetical protein